MIKTMKEDKSVKKAFDSRKQKDNCEKKNPRLPKVKELLKQTSTEITRVQNEPFWISKVDPQNAYGQLKLSRETS